MPSGEPALVPQGGMRTHGRLGMFAADMPISDKIFRRKGPAKAGTTN
jgi:hypothetical protein